MNKLSVIDFLKSPGNSKYQETLAEYAFLKDLLFAAAVENEKVLISRSDFDDFGFDVLVASIAKQVVLNVQLKAVSGGTEDWDIHKSLIKNENGRVIIIKLLDKNGEIEFEYYRLKKDRRDAVLLKRPVGKHAEKCRVHLNDCVAFPKNELLSIFDY